MNVKLSFKKLLFFALLSPALLVSCTKNDEEISTADALTNEEAADLIEGALTLQSDGLSMDLEDASLIVTRSLPCGTAFDTTLTRTFSNSRIESAYLTSFNWSLKCINELPNYLQFSRSTAGTYETSRLTSADKAQSSWEVKYTLSNNTITAKGSYDREGNQASKVRRQLTISSDISINVSEITVNPLTQEITSGSATYAISGNSAISSGETKSFKIEGAITFNGNGTAVIEVNGETFTISLY